MRKLAHILAIAAAFWVSNADAQNSLFPPTLPPNTVVGRTGIGSGPGQALPFGVLAAAIGAPVQPDTFCATMDRGGATDVGGCINSAINAAHTSTGVCQNGNVTVYLRSGIYLITTPIVPKSCIDIVGDGRGKTILLTNSSAPFAQAAGSQLVHFNMSGITFKEAGSNPSATALTFRAGFQGNVLRNLGFHGYTSGTAMNLTANSTVTAFDDTTGIWNSSNSFFNTFEDWVQDDQMATGLILGGNSSTPCNVNTATNVVTLNVFKDVQFWGITGVGWDLVRFVDSNQWIGQNVIRLIGSGAAVITPHASFKNIAVQLGDDNATCAGNNDVALERIQLTVTMGSPATSFVMFNAGNGTFGHYIDFQTDQATSVNSGFTAMTGVTGVDYTINGRNYTPTLDDGVGNLFRLELDQATYRRWMDGTSSLPAVGWAADLTNGLYRPGTGLTGFTGGITSGVNGGNAGSFKANGSTSGSWTAAASATGAPTMTTPWPVAAGGTNCAAASGTCVDNISGFSTTGAVARTGAGTYSIGTLTVANGGTGDTGTAWTAFTPSVTCTSGTWTLNSARSKTLGKTTWIEIDATLGAAACTAVTTFTLPNTSQSPGSINGSETVTSNAAVACRFVGATTTATCVPNGGGNYAATSRIIASGVYENQ